MVNYPIVRPPPPTIRSGMKYCFQIAALFTCLMCMAGEKPPKGVSKHDLKLAQKEYRHALELQKKGQTQQAFEEASRAAELAPGDPQFITAREMLRGQLAGTYLQRGNLLAEVGDRQGAAEQFKTAINVDPQNGYALERLHDIGPDPEHTQMLQLLASVDQIEVVPKPGKQSFHLRGDTRDVYQAIGKAFNINILFDEPLNTQRLRFDVDDIDFSAVMHLAGKMTKTFWAPIANNQAIVANESPEMHRQFDRLSLKTFYVSEAVAPSDLNDVVNVLRTVFEVKFVSMEADKHLITVRAPKEILTAATGMMDDMLQGSPQVLVDIKAFEVSSTYSRQNGLTLPNDFNIFNIPSEIRKILGPVSQSVIDQIIRTGTVDPSLVPANALTQLAGSPLLTPFIFFGGGLGLTGISVTPLSLVGTMNQSDFKNLEHVTMRASQNNPATFRIGTRLPIQSSSFTNVSIDRNGRPVVDAPVANVQYEDIGLTFKATPHIHSDNEVSLDFDLQLRGVGAQSFNGVPVITNRAYVGKITIGDGEPAVLAGMLTEQSDRATSGTPGTGNVPIIRELIDNNSKNHSKSQILIVVTPHIVRNTYHAPGSGIYWKLSN